MPYWFDLINSHFSIGCCEVVGGLRKRKEYSKTKFFGPSSEVLGLMTGSSQQAMNWAKIVGPSPIIPKKNVLLPRFTPVRKRKSGAKSRFVIA